MTETIRVFRILLTLGCLCVAAHAETPLSGRIVVRLKGRRAEEGRRLLAPLGFEIHEDLRPALGALAGIERA